MFQDGSLPRRGVQLPSEDVDSSRRVHRLPELRARAEEEEEDEDIHHEACERGDGKWVGRERHVNGVMGNGWEQRGMSMGRWETGGKRAAC